MNGYKPKLSRKEIYAVPEQRHGMSGASFWYNPWEHGFYPEGGWMEINDFKREQKRLGRNIKWLKYKNSAFFG